MKQKIFSLLALVMTVMTASAIDAPSYNLTVGENAQGSVKFYVAETEVTKAEEGATVTVVITPNTGWVVNQPSGQWYAAMAKAPRRAQTGVDLLKDFELTKLLGQENTWSFVMQRANAEISVSYKKLLTNSDITVQDITALTYSGVAQEPVVTVKDGSVVLTKDVDYTVAYSNNTNAALATAAQNAPTVTITAVATSEKYAGETTKTFTINKKALTVKADNKSVTFGDDAPTYTESYDGFVNNETKTVLSGTLAFACDYVKDQTAAGNYDITPSGLTSDNYDITFTKGTLTVGKKALESSMIANIASLVYNGVAQEPAPVVTFNGMTLEKDVDYTVSYENNVNVGTATATVTALANSTKYSGSASKTFSITKKALTVKADNKKVTYGDDAPQYTVSYDGFVNNETKAVLSGTLSLTCSYVKNQSGAGTYDITPSGYTSDNYDITFTKGTLTVGKKALEDGFIANIASLVYNGVAQEPAPVVTFNGMTLEKDVDYTVSYENNVNVGTATATVTALANSTKYSGSASKTFSITKKALTVKADNKSVTFGDDAPTYTETYDGFVNNETKAVLSGTLALTCSYVKNQTGAGNYDITPSGYTSNNYDITFTKGTLTVGKKALEDGFIANIASLVYNGQAQEPAPVVTFNGMTLVKGTDYTVSYENNVNVGTATATVTALANSTKYSGSASKTFSITKKALTVTADNKQVTYGDDAPQYTVSYDGFMNNETAAVLGGTLSLACDYVKDQSGVGNYTITPSGLTSSNYAITFTNGTLTVGAKALENGFIADIDALTYTSEAQTPAPVLTFHEMTLVANTDYTVAYSNNTNAGTATVTCTGQGNYSGQAQKTFTINPAKLTSVTLAQTEFMFNLYDPQPQTAEIDVVKAGELIVPVEGYDVEGNTQTDVNTYTVKVTGKTNFTGTVTADFVIKDTEVPGTAAETESGEEVDDVTMVLTVADRTEQTLNIENISEGSTSTEGIVVEIPATVNGWKVKTVSANAMANLSNVTDIYLPDTEETAIEVADNALETADGMAVVHAPLQLLDNYAQLLPAHVSNKKVVSDVTQTAKRFWSFSCGVNVELPEGLTANIVLANTETQVTSDPIKGNVVKANNGVLLEGTQGVEYQLTALPATSVGNDYANNLMVPVVEKKHFAYGQGYYILKSGQFYAIANDAAEVPSCKAVMHIAGASARVITIDFDEATSIHNAQFTIHNEAGAIYDLNGRKLNGMPTKKGLYIMNGKKVVVK